MEVTVLLGFIMLVAANCGPAGRRESGGPWQESNLDRCRDRAAGTGIHSLVFHGSGSPGL